MTGQDLKNSILQLAIQGKLVAQDANDEPASELLKRIRAEKERLVKEGKLKKKDLVTTPISDEEKPFEIPESWEWVNIPQIGVSQLGKTKNPNQTLGKLSSYLCSINVYWEGIKTDNMKTMLFTEEESHKYEVKKGDLLICEGGDCGRTAIWDRAQPALYQNALHRVRFYCDINVKYILLCLNLYHNCGMLSRYIKGETIKHLVKTQLDSIAFPLPPLSEQHRIVAKIEELMPLVEEYDKAQTKFDKLNSELPEQLKQSILQEAIMRKLGTQDPNDEPASELLKRIRKEKEQLVKEKKLKKKDLVTTPISDEEKPFEIPENWVWCRLGELVSNRAGLAYQKDNLDIKEGKMIRVLRGGNISFGSWNKYENDVMISSQFVKSDLYLRKGMFITPAVTSLENMGKTALIKDDLDDTVVGGFVLMLQAFLNDEDFLNYMLYIFCSSYYKEYCKSITNKSGQAFYNISRAKLMEMLIPLPPLAEQHRIVEKLDKLMHKIDKLKQ